MHAPVTGETFRADLSGAWLDGRPLTAPARRREAEAVLLTSFPAARHYADLGAAAAAAAPRARRALPRAARPRQRRAAARLGRRRLGRRHARLRTNPWDVAAGALILDRAGGRFVGLSAGEPAAPAHLADDYYGVGAGADYPTLDRVARAVSRRMPARALAEASHA